MSTELRIRVTGTPQQQGSKRAFAFKRKGGGTGVSMMDSNKNLMPWRDRVSQALESKCSELGFDIPAFDGAVSVEMIAVMPRLKTMPKTEKGARRMPTSAPDLDKLQRTIGDSMTESGVVLDDSRICQWLATKRYAEINELAGVEIVVRAFTEDFIEHIAIEPYRSFWSDRSVRE